MRLRGAQDLRRLLVKVTAAIYSVAAVRVSGPRMERVWPSTSESTERVPKEMRLDSEVRPPRLARELEAEDAFERAHATIAFERGDDSKDRAAVVETRNAGVGVRVGHSMLRERPIESETVREDNLKSKAGSLRAHTGKAFLPKRRPDPSRPTT